MGLVWNTWGALSLLVALTSWFFAGFVYATQPRRVPNRVLAIVLALEGALFFGGQGLAYSTDDYATAFGSVWINWAFTPAYLVACVALVATLRTPLVRPFRNRLGVGALGFAALAETALFFARPEMFITGLAPVPYAAWDLVPGPWFQWANLTFLLVFVYTFVAAASAWAIAPRRSATRVRAGFFALAFGLRDLFFAVVFAAVLFFPFENLPYLFLLGAPLVFLAYQLLLVYGILKHQLFGIDLRIKFTIRQGTVATIFIAVFFVVSETMATLLSERVGTYVGIAAAGALLFFLAPIQQFAERLSNRAMPNVEDTPEYHVYRKFEVYRGAFEVAYRDRKITARERAVLDTLMARLDLSRADAERLERDARAANS